FSFPTAIRFGAGTLKELPDHLRRLGSKKPLLVTDTGLAKAPIFGALKDVLNSAGIQFAEFAGVEPNPLPSHVEAGVAAYKAGSCGGRLGLGGRSGLRGA